MLGDEAYEAKIVPITQALAAHIYETAFDGHSLANECDRGVVNTHRVWWVQAETVVGFLNACEQMPDHSEYRDAALAVYRVRFRTRCAARGGSQSGA